jgi:hypothetical protein
MSDVICASDFFPIPIFEQPGANSDRQARATQRYLLVIFMYYSCKFSWRTGLDADRPELSAFIPAIVP